MKNVHKFLLIFNFTLATIAAWGDFYIRRSCVGLVLIFLFATVCQFDGMTIQNEIQRDHKK